MCTCRKRAWSQYDYFAWDLTFRNNVYTNQSDRFDRSTAKCQAKEIILCCTLKIKSAFFGRERTTANECVRGKKMKTVPNIGFHWIFYCIPNAKCHSTRITFNLFASRKFTTCTIVNNDNNIYGLNETNLFHSHNPKALRQFPFNSESVHVHTFARTFIRSGFNQCI